jgi:hypothetical protein
MASRRSLTFSAASWCWTKLSNRDGEFWLLYGSGLPQQAGAKVNIMPSERVLFLIFGQGASHGSAASGRSNGNSQFATSARARSYDLLREVCSAKWVIDGDTFDLAPMAHILGEQFAAAERASGSQNRCIPIRQPVYRLDFQCTHHDW